MERNSVSNIIIFTLDGEASPILVLHVEISVTALWSQVDCNSCEVIDPSTHTHCKTSRECANPR